MKIDFSQIKFLIAEDNLYSRRNLRGMLKGLGTREIMEADDGPSAVEIFMSSRVDMVLIDWDMPLLDGVEVTRMIRQPAASPNPYAPVIMITGFADKTRVKIARDAGVTEFIAKPFSTQTLYAKILVSIATPRPFVKTKTFFGPSRRRTAKEIHFMADRRRNSGRIEVVPQSDSLSAKALER